MEERFVPVPAAEARPIDDGAAIAGTAPAEGDRSGIADPRALQIISTEHWSLLTARSLVYNETFARGGMFLAVLSATLVALGLISTGGFNDAFLVVATVVLALDLFIGLATLGRINAASDEDLRYLQGMNRLRHAYFEMVPGLEKYFITSGYDDFESIAMHYGPVTTSPVRQLLHGFTTMPGMISTICAALMGVLVAVLTLLLTHDGSLAAILGIVSTGLCFVVMTALAVRMVLGFLRSFVPIFPRPKPDPTPPER